MLCTTMGERLRGLVHCSVSRGRGECSRIYPCTSPSVHKIHHQEKLLLAMCTGLIFN
ncbi:unnamed protein product [Ixodes persulcatus]